MNITPINLYTDNTKKSYIAGFKPVRTGLFLKETIGDTVSFGAAGPQETIKLSQKIFNFVRAANYHDALKVIRSKAQSAYDPNYFEPMADGNKVSLMGLLLDNFKDININKLNKTAAEGILLFSAILYNNDFAINNKDADGDLFKKAIHNHIPVEMMYMMYNSPGFAMVPINSKNYAQYTQLLMSNGYEEIADDVQATIEAMDEDDYDFYGPDEDVNINLDDYKVTQGPYDPKSLDDVGGMFDIKEDIREYILRPWDEKYRARLEQNGIKRPSGVLLSGPPGCGKTYIAQALAAEAGYDFYSISLADVGDKWAYVTTKKIPAIFKALAEKYEQTGVPSIVFLDEMDSIASNREGANSDWRRADINALLTSINNSSQNGVILIGATNFYDAIDKAALRAGRMDVVIKITYPDRASRKDIVEKVLMGKEVATDIIKQSDVIAQKTDGMTPADISSILNIMCLKAIYNFQDQATMQNFDDAVKIHERKKKMNDIRPIGFVSEKRTTESTGTSDSTGCKYERRHAPGPV